MACLAHSCAAYAAAEGVTKVDAAWCALSCGASPPNCPASLCRCSGASSDATAAAPAPVAPQCSTSCFDVEPPPGWKVNSCAGQQAKGMCGVLALDKAKVTPTPTPTPTPTQTPTLALSLTLALALSLSLTLTLTPNPNPNP